MHKTNWEMCRKIMNVIINVIKPIRIPRKSFVSGGILVRQMGLEGEELQTQAVDNVSTP